MTDTPAFVAAQRAFARHLRDPDNVPAPPLPAERLAVYRRAVRHNVAEFMGNNFPRVRALLTGPRWDALIDDYLANHQASAAAFARLPDEFLAYLNARGVRGDEPGCLLELSHFEWLENHLCCDERILPLDNEQVQDGDLLDDEIVINPVHMLVDYAWPVHVDHMELLSEAAPARPTHLVAFRTRDFSFAVLDLNAVSRELFMAIRENGAPPARQFLEALASRLGHATPDAVLRGGADILSRMRARELILGTRPRA